jgi:hypothetical protein
MSYELHYSTGGTGGPYKTLNDAQMASMRLLKGNINEKYIDIKSRHTGEVVQHMKRSDLAYQQVGFDAHVLIEPARGIDYDRIELHIDLPLMLRDWEPVPSYGAMRPSMQGYKSKSILVVKLRKPKERRS